MSSSPARIMAARVLGPASCRGVAAVSRQSACKERGRASGRCRICGAQPSPHSPAQHSTAWHSAAHRSPALPQSLPPAPQYSAGETLKAHMLSTPLKPTDRVEPCLASAPTPQAKGQSSDAAHLERAAHLGAHHIRHQLGVEVGAVKDVLHESEQWKYGTKQCECVWVVVCEEVTRPAGRGVMLRRSALCHAPPRRSALAAHLTCSSCPLASTL